MAITRMLTEAEAVGDLIGRVLDEAGIEFVFGISGGHTGRIITGLRKYQNSVRMITVREESLGGVMAEVYGRAADVIGSGCPNRTRARSTLSPSPMRSSAR